MVEQAASIGEQQEASRIDVVSTVLERIVTDVEAANTDEVFDILAQIEALQARNRHSIDDIDRVLEASTLSDGKWAIQWPVTMDSAWGDADDDEKEDGTAEGRGDAGAPSHREKKQFAAEFLDCLIEDATRAFSYVFLCCAVFCWRA
jgi:hypothetical protein